MEEQARQEHRIPKTQDRAPPRGKVKKGPTGGKPNLSAWVRKKLLKHRGTPVHTSTYRRSKRRSKSHGQETIQDLIKHTVCLKEREMT